MKFMHFFYSVKSTDLTNPFALNGGNSPYLTKILVISFCTILSANKWNILI